MPLIELTETEQAQLATVRDHRQSRATASQIEEFGARIQRTLVMLLTHAQTQLTAGVHPAVPAAYCREQATQLLSQASSQFPVEKLEGWADRMSVLGYDPEGILVADKAMKDSLSALANTAGDGSDLAAVCGEIAARFTTPDTPWL